MSWSARAVGCVALLFAAEVGAQDLYDQSFSGTVDGAACTTPNQCTWGGLVRLTGDVLIPAGVTVNVQAFATVAVTTVGPARVITVVPSAPLAVHYLVVEGRLVSDRGLFTSARHIDSGYTLSEEPGDWGGIRVGVNGSARFVDSEIKFATHALIHDTSGLVEFVNGSIESNRHDLGLPCNDDAWGAGIAKKGNGPLTIAGTTVRYNTVISCVAPDEITGIPAVWNAIGAGLAGFTGGITIDGAKFENNIVAANDQPNGAAIGFTIPAATPTASIVIKNSTFQYNLALGGMAFCSDTSVGCGTGTWQFRSPSGGAGVFVKNMAVTLTDNFFLENAVLAGTRRYNATQYGSYDNATADDGLRFNQPPPVGTSTASAASRHASALGGAILAAGTTTKLTAERNYLKLNKVGTRHGWWADVTSLEEYWCGGGGFAAIDDPELYVANNLITGNAIESGCTGYPTASAPTGGLHGYHTAGSGVFVSTSGTTKPIVFVNNTIAQNGGQYFDASGMYADMAGPLVLRNNLFWLNAGGYDASISGQDVRGAGFYDHTARATGTSVIVDNDSFEHTNAWPNDYSNVATRRDYYRELTSSHSVPPGNFAIVPGITSPSGSIPCTARTAADYHLTQTSALRDLASAGAPSGDYDGQNRDALPDVGFDEVFAVRFTQATSSANEDDGVFTVIASLNAPAATGLTIPFTRGGTASAGDATLSALSFVFSPGLSTAAISITPTADALREADETLSLTLGAPPLDTFVDAPAAHVATILNDDPVPTLTIAGLPTSTLESAGSIALTLSLSNPTESDVSVTLAASGTATLGADAMVSAVMVTLPAGTTTALVSVDLVDDLFVEGDETLTLAVSAIVNAIDAGPVTLTIVDNEASFPTQSPGAPPVPMPTVGDSDGDGLADAAEIALGTSPFDADSDDDGVGDGSESALDSDGDGMANPLDPDSDNDGLLDGTELSVTSPIVDPDGDGPLLGTELSLFVPDSDPTTSTNPLDPDTDGGGVSDGAEDRDGNGAVDTGEIDPSAGHGDDDVTRMDRDGDGIFDLVGASGGGSCRQAGTPGLEWLCLAIIGVVRARLRRRTPDA